MCEINFEKTVKERVGYKVLAYRKGKYYSTFTGQRIKAGDVPLPPMKLNRLNTAWNVNKHMNFTDSYIYNPRIIGFTSIFTKIEDAIKFKERWIEGNERTDHKTVVVRITFTEDSKVYKGKYFITGIFETMKANVIAGNKIKSIRQIK